MLRPDPSDPSDLDPSDLKKALAGIDGITL